ncbi:GMC family oxidoreductase [Luteibacter sp. PPL201]|uniref:GMC family oxidoreductase n=1 Tax=Luteibacter sahnii TaxID=3021977 RepID=A0ABT6BDE8_9GAMM|nr:GMC family oxidoreductase [Luteibacter sp. PPL193]
MENAVLLDYLDPSVPNDYDADLCIVGGGPAGIAIARAFAGTRVRVCLVEGGGLTGEDRTQALYDGRSIGPYPLDAGTARMRVLGGSCTLWGGGCIPFADSDLEPREWVPDSGWPLRYADLAPWYAKAQAFCRIDASHGFGPGAFDGPTARPLLDLAPEAMTNFIFARSPITFGDAYREDLHEQPHLTALLHANAMELDANTDASAVTGLRIGSVDGRRGHVRARHYVLAAGGIENARILLLSDTVAPGGLGNDRDLVGRYFMDHPSGTIGSVYAAQPDRLTRPYERSVGKRRTPVAAEIGLSTDAQRTHRILNGRVHPFAVEGDVPRGLRALRDVRAALRPPVRDESALLEARLCAALQNGPSGAAAMPQGLVVSALRLGLNLGDVIRAVSQKINDRPTVRSGHVDLVGFFEQAPNRDSRITLGDDRDALGLRKVQVDWRLTDLDRHSWQTLTTITGDRLAATCDGRFERAAWLSDGDVTAGIHGTAHHMGTTRMATSPTQGVVDVHGKVHGVDNLHVAGSSVFPTGGWAFPTFTLVALSLRLAEHLRMLLGVCEGGVV